MEFLVDIEKKIGDFHLKVKFQTNGERLALLGASGCGKSMTLKCIAGIERPDRGKIVIGDRVLFDSEKKIDLPARQRRVGYLFQNYALFPNMTVRQNISCVAGNPMVADELMKRFGLTDVASQYPAELSGGQSQRTALARMLAAGPEAILLDEPFSALDNHMRTRMEHEILDILESFSGPSVLVTHDRNEAYRLADRIGVIEAGDLVECEEKRAFFDSPETVAAARLTGCKNISRLFRKGDGTFQAADWGICIEAESGMKIAPDITHIGYRAHYFSFLPEEHNSGQSEKNIVNCDLKRVIEDTFSVVVCFTQKGKNAEEPDALMTWIVGREEWESVKNSVMSGRFRLKLHPEQMMFLRER